MQTKAKAKSKTTTNQVTQDQFKQVVERASAIMFGALGAVLAIRATSNFVRKNPHEKIKAIQDGLQLLEKSL